MSDELKTGPRLSSLDPAWRTRHSAHAFTYSKIVRKLRIGLPFVALGLVLFLFHALSEGEKSQMNLTETTTQSRAAIEMTSANYQGFDKDNQPYAITATRATRSFKDENVVDLENPQADVTLNSGDWIAAQADFGTYFQIEKKLTLSGVVKLFHDSGYELKTGVMDVYINEGRAAGETPVSAHGPAGRLEAQNLHIENRGESIVFGGPATLMLYNHTPLTKKPAKG